MYLNAVPVDSSFLVALYSVDSEKHIEARAFFAAKQRRYYVPDTALTEVAYFLINRSGERAVESFFFAMASKTFNLECMTPADMQRIREIRSVYRSAKLDFVDCYLIAISERMNIKVIVTYDRRGFSIVHPMNFEHFELLP